MNTNLANNEDALLFLHSHAGSKTSPSNVQGATGKANGRKGKASNSALKGKLTIMQALRKHRSRMINIVRDKVRSS